MQSPLCQTRRLAVHAMPAPIGPVPFFPYLFDGPPSTNGSRAGGTGNDTIGSRIAGPFSSASTIVTRRPLEGLTSADTTLRQDR